MSPLSLALALAAFAAPPAPQLDGPGGVVGRLLFANCWLVAAYSGRDGLHVFPVAPEAGGRRSGTFTRFAFHPLHSVRFGDIVTVDYYRTRNRPTCVGLVIMERPGGRVPPAEGPIGKKPYRPYHEIQNADNDKEKAARDARVAQRLAGTYVPPPRQKKPAAGAKP